MNKIGVDLGGTKIEGILLDESLNVVKKIRIPTQQEKGYDSIIKSIVSLFDELKTKSNSEFTIGLSTPGAISKKTGLIKNSNTQCIIGKPLQEDIQKCLDHDITIENDANCFALAETILGDRKSVV